MNTNSNSTTDQDIDLSVLTDKVKSFFGNIAFSLFKCILFLKNNSRVFAFLIIGGGILGYTIDHFSKSYRHELIVTPYYGSVDYLYTKIDYLQTKINQNDQAFFKSIGVQEAENVNEIEVEPIIDLYNFINNGTAGNKDENSQNFEMIKLLAEESDINKVIKEKLTSKNYNRHLITISTKKVVSEKNTITPLLLYLNNDAYLNKIRAIYTANVKDKIQKNEEVIKQIDGLLNSFAATSNSTQQNNKLVYYNENTQLNELIATKNGLIRDIGLQKIELINLDYFIKATSTVVNLKNTSKIYQKKTILLPIIFVIGYILYSFLSLFYKKQAAKLNPVS
ncbi:hypothetical protein B0A58_03495 [Flavobacterium branchiophilum NBRC 15030 = ATCC 35035]|uniref:Uncharacterized protein n=2 Tax=Flavobacterium branchiophilum TaxID=55197 RepID=G2Z6B1_FLABF|nr:hypothetical protein [Flavobacterium branchiophilum]OXA79191.1 hypothetical protein B0A58_03495 [Flavobacterium branchiophilum NBRC 15030 = ATCC 35035]PDS23497.1 hypothetical protein B0A77_10765 [Flavobacterium branchiophilum]TQM40325.1 hypothetical protein BC670_1206 [Flavobacterium branchiophilum]CCB70931.1 Protein of unknown function [Flavobacterium branchiophilum FL-15]GEM56534.1 hypothetical protein FB1_27550 [Flavobacterium branchiophilum NBRC 15030 = ATCC 35035]